MGPSSVTARRWAAVVALAAFVLAAAAGFAAQRDRPLALPAAQAIAIASKVEPLDQGLRPGDRPKVIYVDDHLVKVMWYRGDRAVATAGVDDHGKVIHRGMLDKYAGWGAPFSHAPAVLLALSLLFLVATLRRPLRRLRTLDAVALAALVVPASLLDRGYFGLALGICATLLLYLAARATWLAVRGPAPDDDPSAPVLLVELAARRRLPRLPAQVGFTLLAATLLVIVTSNGIVDIAIADMEGATVLIHGSLPYGNMPGDIVHGDTYGLPIYAIYAPFAALWPMTSDWDDPIGALIPNALLVCLCLAGAATAARGVRWPAVIALLAFPAALMSSSSGTNDVIIAAALIWAFAWWSRPAASAALVMFAATAKVAPLILLPLWLARLRGAALARALVACAAVAAVTLAGLLALGGLDGPKAMAHAIGFQFARRSELSIWTALGLQPLQPLAQALVIALVAGGTVLAWLDRAVATDPRRIAALTTAILAVLQVSANHWAPMYLMWFAPPALIALLGPLGAPAPERVAEDETVPATARFAPV